MAVNFEPPSVDSWLRQSEFIAGLIEPRVLPPLEEGRVQPRTHPYAIVVNADCDLEWDYKARFDRDVASSEGKLIPSIVFCHLASRDQLRAQGVNAELWRRIRSNQHDRYHWLDSTENQDPALTTPEFVADFKALFSLPTELAYQQVTTGQARRIGVLTTPYQYQLIQRLFFYHMRIGIDYPP